MLAVDASSVELRLGAVDAFSAELRLGTLCGRFLCGVELKYYLPTLPVWS